MDFDVCCPSCRPPLRRRGLEEEEEGVEEGVAVPAAGAASQATSAPLRQLSGLTVEAKDSPPSPLAELGTITGIRAAA